MTRCESVDSSVRSCKNIHVADCASDKRDTISYVIINPSYDVKLEPNDIM